jgi:hypothetical protein
MSGTVGTLPLRIVVGALLAAAWLVVAGCGDDGAQQQAAASGDAGDADTPAAGQAPGDTSAAVAMAPGTVVHYPEARFQVLWPAGCEDVELFDSEGPTPAAGRELTYRCERGGADGTAYSVSYLQNAHATEGAAPGPHTVVDLIEVFFARLDAKVVRQRPLQSGAIQGVEAQAEQNDGDGEVWLRGLLVGPDIYLIVATNEAGGVFDSPRARAFFASFRVEP